MILNIVPGSVKGLTPDEQDMLGNLLQIYNAHSFKNAEKDRICDSVKGLERMSFRGTEA